MILRDKVRIIYRVATGATDPRGNPIYTDADVTVPAEVSPAGGTDSRSGRDLIALGRYDIVLPPSITLPPSSWATLKLYWSPLGATTPLYVDGTVDPVTANGRIHHYELTTKSVTFT